MYVRVYVCTDVTRRSSRDMCVGVLMCSACVFECELRGVNWPVKMHIFVMINPSPNRTEA